MIWREAFKKAIAATGWMIVFLVVSGVIIGVGVFLGAFNALWEGHANVGSVVAG